jgi:hypothetical protein
MISLRSDSSCIRRNDWDVVWGLQRHVARALWHLATAEESRHLLVEQGGLAALQRLVDAPDSRGQFSRTLAQQGLRRIAEDQALRGQLPPDVLLRLDDCLTPSTSNLQTLLLSPGFFLCSWIK